MKQAKTKSKPVHEHDCDACIYLGTYHESNGRALDCYYCADELPKFPEISREGYKIEHSLIARFGECGDYHSFSHIDPFAEFYDDRDNTSTCAAWLLAAYSLLVRATIGGLQNDGENRKK